VTTMSWRARSSRPTGRSGIRAKRSALSAKAF
jgi:hypothetical protein